MFEASHTSGPSPGPLDQTIRPFRGLFTLLFSVIAGIALTSTILAHHSTSAEFDGSRRIALSGTITKVEWANPHTFFYVDVRAPKSGNVVKWACELGSPNMLVRLG